MLIDLDLAVKPGDDSFLKEILPVDGVEETIPILGIGLSPDNRIYFIGKINLEIIVPILKSFGPVTFSTLHIQAKSLNGDFLLVIGASLQAKIGPVAVNVEKIGIGLPLSFPPQGGNLGPIQIDSPRFKFPDAIGVFIDNPGIKGGGFLRVDSPNYAGAFELSVQDQFAISAFGMLSTKLPDGTDRFSLLFSLMAQFAPPIQIGFGFALSGVGGLIGINRHINEEALRQAVKNHQIDHILFPEDLVTNATMILTTVDVVIPIQDGLHIFGPMVKLIWGGTKKLVEFDLGIFVEIGGPGRVAILGLAHSALPKPEKPILVLNCDIFGSVDFGNKTLAIDSSLFDSHVLNKFTLSGQMALRSNWGDDPDFALSLGGFYPGYSPPSGFPKLQRLQVSLGKGNPRARISVSMYFAITTNTLQTGGRIELRAKKKKIKLKATFGIDALITFSPFMFEALVNASASVKYRRWKLASVSLEFTLSGPNQFRAKGFAKFKVSRFKKKIKFNKTFGDKKPEDLPVVSPREVLQYQLEVTNPRYELSKWINEGVVLTKEAESFASPIGECLISQNAVPLTIQMDKFAGGVPPENESKLSIEIAGDGIRTIDNPPQTNFAPAQFKKWSENKQISAPPFEKFVSGVRFSGGEAIPITPEKLDVEYETLVVNPSNPNPNEVIYTRVNKNNGKSFSMASLANGNEDLQLVRQMWRMQGAGKYFKPLKKVVDKNNPNYVEIADPSFTVTGHEYGEEGYKRAKINGSETTDMTFTETQDLTGSMDTQNVVVRDSTAVESHNSGG
jgi:hypothetical protein